MPSKKSEVNKNKKETPEEETEYSPNEVLTLLEWTAPGRPFKKRTKQYYLTALLIMLLVEIILFLFSQYLLMIVVLSLVFVTFALAFIPPRDFNFRISTQGIMLEDRFYLWQELYDFYFKKIEGVDTIHIRTVSFVPGELVMTLGNVTEDEAKKALLPFLPFREYIKPTFVEKWGDWLSRNFPLENK